MNYDCSLTKFSKLFISPLLKTARASSLPCQLKLSLGIFTHQLMCPLCAEREMTETNHRPEEHPGEAVQHFPARVFVQKMSVCHSRKLPLQNHFSFIKTPSGRV